MKTNNTRADKLTSLFHGDKHFSSVLFQSENSERLSLRPDALFGVIKECFSCHVELFSKGARVVLKSKHMDTKYRQDYSNNFIKKHSKCEKQKINYENEKKVTGRGLLEDCRTVLSGHESPLSKYKFSFLAPKSSYKSSEKL